MAGKTLAEFKSIMDELNLPKPKRLDEAVPANRQLGPSPRCGRGRRPRPVPPLAMPATSTPQLACEWWQKGDAVLVDVRTDAEREWVGFVPGAVAAGLEAVARAWR